MSPGQPYEVMIHKGIAERAYRYWERRGKPVGSPEIDWYQAVEEENHERRRHGLDACSKES